jgi:glutathione synthase
MTKKKLAVVMDPIAEIIPEKDGTLGLLLEAQSRSYELIYFEQQDLRIINGIAMGSGRQLTVEDNVTTWFSLSDKNEIPLLEFDVILMRKDPPFNTEYIYTTYMLDLAESSGVLVINSPVSLRNFNEKVSVSFFPECAAPSLVTSSINHLQDFLKLHKKIVVKPLDGMGGKSIFVIAEGDLNTNSILEIITHENRETVMAQLYIPEVLEGDKRIHIVDGKHADVLLARIPLKTDNRGNLVAGAQPKTQALSENDKRICNLIGPKLQASGIFFAGIDVIGNFLTEINITSPTGMREIKKYADYDVVGIFFDLMEKKLND